MNIFTAILISMQTLKKSSNRVVKKFRSGVKKLGSTQHFGVPLEIAALKIVLLSASATLPTILNEGGSKTDLGAGNRRVSYKTH